MVMVIAVHFAVFIDHYCIKVRLKRKGQIVDVNSDKDAFIKMLWECLFVSVFRASPLFTCNSEQKTSSLNIHVFTSSACSLILSGSSHPQCDRDSTVIYRASVSCLIYS